MKRLEAHNHQWHTVFHIAFDTYADAMYKCDICKKTEERTIELEPLQPIIKMPWVLDEETCRILKLPLHAK